MSSKKLTVIIKPTNACNLRCEYCYNNYDNYSNERMSIYDYKKILDSLVDDFEDVRFIWHGGEPLVMGVDFFIRAIDLQHEYTNKYGILFHNSLQTNATLIDKTWCDFFKKNSFNIGISFDGPPYGISGRNGTEEAIKGIQILKRENIHFGCIAVINQKNLKFINEIYDFFNRECIPVDLNCVFESGCVSGEGQYLLVDPAEYVLEFCRLFDRWVIDGSSTITINPFVGILEALLHRPNCCEYTGCMYKYLAIDHRGVVFPCGRFGGSGMEVGFIDDCNHLGEIFNGQKYEAIVRKSIIRRNKCKEKCDVYKYCNGGCNANALYAGNLENTDFVQCTMYKGLLKHIESYLRECNNTEIVNPRIKRIMKGGGER